MIDCENQIFTKLATALRTAYPGINVQGTVTYTPSVFPTVCIEEADNFSFRQTRDTASNENCVEVMYEVNVYSNLFTGAKTQCKNIFSTIDSVMDELGFTRTEKTPVPAEQPMTYRLIGRYSAVIDKYEKIYRR